jgi:hypothetical protein
VSERAARWRRPFGGAADRSLRVRSPRRLALWAEQGHRLRSVVVLLAVVLGFVLLVQRGTGLGMPSRPPVWVVDAVPAAVSEVVYGREKPYTSLAVVTDQYATLLGATPSPDGPTVDRAIARIAALDPSTVDRSYRLLGVDDKGIVDFVALAFRLFGLQVAGVFWLYVVVLGLSCGLFTLAWFDRPTYLAALAGLLTAYFLIMPTLAFNPQVTSILALRVFPALSMVACLHGLLFIAGPSASPRHLGTLVAQLGLIIVVEHVRSTTAWQVMVLVVAALAASALRARQRRGWRPVLLTCCPLLLVLVGQVALERYRAWAYPIEYQRGDQILTRGIWHNIFSGFALEPEMAARYALKIDDVSIMGATGQYLQESGRAQDWLEMGGGSPHFTRLRWAAYDQAVRDMLVARCTATPGPCLAAVTRDKPRSLLGHLAWVYGLRELPPDLDAFTSPEVGDTLKNQITEATHRLDETGLRAHPWSPGVLLLSVLLAWTMLGAQSGEARATGLAVGALWAGSLLPSLIGYPAPHAIAEPAIATCILVVSGLSAAAARGLRQTWVR